MPATFFVCEMGRPPQATLSVRWQRPSNGGPAVVGNDEPLDTGRSELVLRCRGDRVTGWAGERIDMEVRRVKRGEELPASNCCVHTEG